MGGPVVEELREDLANTEPAVGTSFDSEPNKDGLLYISQYVTSDHIRDPPGDALRTYQQIDRRSAWDLEGEIRN